MSKIYLHPRQAVNKSNNIRAMIKKLGKLQGQYLKIRDLHFEKAGHPKTSLKS